MKDLENSLIAAAMLKIIPRKNVKTYIYLDYRLLQVLRLNGLDISNYINLLLEKDLKEKNLLTPEILEKLENISNLEKGILTKGVIEVLLQNNLSQIVDEIKKNCN